MVCLLVIGLVATSWNSVRADDDASFEEGKTRRCALVEL